MPPEDETFDDTQELESQDSQGGEEEFDPYGEDDPPETNDDPDEGTGEEESDDEEESDEPDAVGAAAKAKDDSEGSGEPKEPGKEGGEKKRAAPQETVELDGEKIPKADLHAAWKARQTSEISAREAKRTKEAVQYAYEQLAENPFKILLDIHTRRTGNREQAEQVVAQLAEDYALPFMQEKLMTEEQRESARMKRRVKYYEESEQERRRREEEQKLADETKRYSEWISGQITEAIKASGIPDKPAIVKQMAAILHGQMEAGEKPDPHFAAAQIKQDIEELRAGLLKQLTPEDIRAQRQDLLEEARKADIETAREKRRQPTARNRGASREGSTRRNGRGRKPVYRSMEEFREAVGVDIYQDTDY